MRTRIHPFGTHQPFLIDSVLKTEGTILELGAGYYSTHILHILSENLNRKLITVETNSSFYKEFVNFQSNLHQVINYSWPIKIDGKFERVNISTHVKKYLNLLKTLDLTDVGVIFIDQGPPLLRTPSIEYLKDYCDTFVLHDAERSDQYNYVSIFKYFSIRNLYTDYMPHTLILKK